MYCRCACFELYGIFAALLNYLRLINLHFVFLRHYNAVTRLTNRRQSVLYLVVLALDLAKRAKHFYKACIVTYLNARFCAYKLIIQSARHIDRNIYRSAAKVAFFDISRLYGLESGDCGQHTSDIINAISVLRRRYKLRKELTFKLVSAFDCTEPFRKSDRQLH